MGPKQQIHEMSSKLLDQQIAKRKINKEELQKAYKASQQVGKHIMPSGDIHRPPGPEQNFLVLSYVTPDGSTEVPFSTFCNINRTVK